MFLNYAKDDADLLEFGVEPLLVFLDEVEEARLIGDEIRAELFLVEAKSKALILRERLAVMVEAQRQARQVDDVDNDVEGEEVAMT